MTAAATNMTSLSDAREEAEREAERETQKVKSSLLARYFNWSIGTKINVINAISGMFGATLVGMGWFSLNAIETSLLTSGINAPEVIAIAHNGKAAFVMLLILAIFWTIIANYRIGKDITVGLKRITPMLWDVIDGKMDMDVPYRHRKDELGDIARSVEVFRRASIKLQQVRGEREEALAREQDIRDEQNALRESQTKKLQKLSESFEHMIGNIVSSVASASSQLNSTATSMASSAEVSSSQISSVTKAMEDASKGVTAAAAASDEFAMSIGEISRQASSSAELARKATGAADQANSTISTLSNSAEEVSQVVELIQSIAQRTNLLALNASIEAARGSDSGRGFAVVAAEVKELASQTSKATQDVADQINSMQESTSASVSALRSIGQQIQQLESTAVSIAAAVDQQAVAGQDLAKSIDIAARGADEASTNIGKVQETTLATGSAATQVLESSTDLEKQAVTLRDQVEKYMGQARTMEFFK